MYDMPPRTATERFLTQMAVWGRRIDISFDVDLGELVEGQVIARGLELRGAGAVLHYEFLPHSYSEFQFAGTRVAGFLEAIVTFGFVYVVARRV